MNGVKAESQARLSSPAFREGYERVEWTSLYCPKCLLTLTQVAGEQGPCWECSHCDRSIAIHV